MKTNWKVQAERMVALIERDGPQVCLEQEVLEILVDLMDRAPLEYGRVRAKLKAVRALSDVERSMKRHAYVEPSTHAQSDTPHVEVIYNKQKQASDVLQHLLAHPDVYYRGGVLVRVIAQPEGRAPVARAYTHQQMHALMTACVVLTRTKHTKQGVEVETVDPSRHFVETVLGLGDFPGARPLRGITTGPIVHPNGALVSRPGYDPVTRYYCAYDGPALVVPEASTRDDALQALSAITDLISDFPFEAPSHRSAWLAGVLTLLLRPTVLGSVVLFLISANAPGSGKTMLADAASVIVLGEPLPRRPYLDDDRELNATISSILFEGDLAALYDNVDRAFGGAIIDLVATGDRLKVRAYGTNNECLDLDAGTVFLATGNNLTVRGDLARRVLMVQLNVEHEQPETRSGFRYPDLLKTTRELREALLTALLTMVRAFIQAGRPSPDIAPLGSFEVWSEWVRNLLLWLGEADPVESQVSLREDQNAPLRALLDAWEKMFGLDRAVTITEAVCAIAEAERALRNEERDGSSSSSMIAHFNRQETERGGIPARALEGALKDLGMVSVASANAAALGKKFKQFEKKHCHGRMFVCDRKENTNAWKVVATDCAPTDVPTSTVDDQVKGQVVPISVARASSAADTGGRRRG